MRILKFRLDTSKVNTRQTIDMPIDAKVIDAMFIDNELFVWVEAINKIQTRPKDFYIIRTGYDRPGIWYKHIRTLRNNSLIYHVYVWVGE